VAVPPVGLVDDQSVGHVVGGEQAGGGVPHVVVRHPGGGSGQDGQARGGAVEGLVIWGNEDPVPRCRRSPSCVRVRDRKSKRRIEERSRLDRLCIRPSPSRTVSR
jgi:hypothetical protein